ADPAYAHGLSLHDALPIYTFRVPVDERVRKRFNIAPTQDAPVVRVAKDGAREVAMLRWGLVPFWAKDAKVGTKMINARSEEARADRKSTRLNPVTRSSRMT